MYLTAARGLVSPCGSASRFTGHGSPAASWSRSPSPSCSRISCEINRDLFYGLYATAVAGLLAFWAHSTGYDLVAAVKRRWLVAVGLGSAFAGVLALMVVHTEDATARPDGVTLVGAVLWRGVLYGVTDGLLLSVFPILVVFAAFAGSRLNDRFAGKIVIGAVAPDRLARDDGRLPRRLQRLPLRQDRQAADRRRRMERPDPRDTQSAGSTNRTRRPARSAVLHSYDTDTFLPPHK